MRNENALRNVRIRPLRALKDPQEDSMYPEVKSENSDCLYKWSVSEAAAGARPSGSLSLAALKSFGDDHGFWGRSIG